MDPELFKNCPQNSTDPNCSFNLPQVAAESSTLQQVLTIVFGVIAAIAVIIIVVQGIKFVLSQGDPQKAADARKGVIYAAVGLVVAISAEIIVNTVLGKI